MGKHVSETVRTGEYRPAGTAKHRKMVVGDVVLWYPSDDARPMQIQFTEVGSTNFVGRNVEQKWDTREYRGELGRTILVPHWSRGF